MWWSRGGRTRSNLDYLTIKYDSATGDELWSIPSVYEGGDHDYAESIATDLQGNIVVTGVSYNGSNYDWLTIKYAPYGNKIWDRAYAGWPADYLPGASVATDPSGEDSGHGVFLLPRLR